MHLILFPFQVGTGVPVGCEVIVHAVNSVHDDTNVPSGPKWTLHLDYSNSFSCINCEMTSRGESSYSFYVRLDGELLCGSTFATPWRSHHLELLWYSTGRSFRSPGFALALHPIVEKIKKEVPGLLIEVWYLDDSTICGSAEHLLKALAISEEEGPLEG